jgi:hypothetical protein
MAVSEGLEVDNDPLAHRDPSLDRRGAGMRQQDDVVQRAQPRVDCWLVLKHMEAWAGSGVRAAE